MSDAGTLRSLDRGLQCLELLAQKDRSPSELARVLQVDRATVHRLLRTLEGRGYVERDGRPGRYRLRSLHPLARHAAPAEDSLSNWLGLARAQLVRLNEATGLSANLCVPDGTDVVYFAQVLAREGLVVNRPPGTRRPAYCSAVGKAYLGALPDHERAALLRGVSLTPRTPCTITDLSRLEANLAHGCARGFHVDDREFHPHVRCIAAPILDENGHPLASLGVSGPVDVITDERLDDLGDAVRTSADAVSEVLGYHRRTATP